MPVQYRVALVLNRRSVDEWRAFFLAAHSFAQVRRDWHIIRNGGYTNHTWEFALAQKPDGILATIEADQLPPSAAEAHRVLVLNSAVKDFPFRRVSIDYEQAGRKAAEYLIERQLSAYAYVGWSSIGYSCEIERGFMQAIRQSGLTTAATSFDLDRQDGVLFVPPGQWFTQLPKPCGIVCANDGLGVRIIVASQDNGFSVPEDIAVMGVGDDEMQCVQSPIPLTSVSRDLKALGLGAAEYLDQWMRRDDLDASEVRYPVGEVVARQSTLVFGESDPIVRRALMLIHVPDARPMTVELLLDLLGDVSRRRLEALFRRRLNRTPYQEILRARIEHAKRLLVGSSLSVDEIAFRSGFSCSIHFSRPFKARSGMTPLAYRRKHQVK